MRIAVRAALALASVVVVSGCAGPAARTPGAEDPTEPGGPPAATMTVDGVAHRGELGSYTLPDRGDDGPWLSGGALEPAVRVVAGTTMTIALVDAGITAWTAVYADALDPRPDQPFALARSDAPAPAAGIEIRVPPPGDWVVMARLDYPSGGSGAYYWRLVVAP
jgi:hypothetical protein